MTELAYKFTKPGAVSPFTGFEWPVGEWVEVEGETLLLTTEEADEWLERA